MIVSQEKTNSMIELAMVCDGSKCDNVATLTIIDSPSIKEHLQDKGWMLAGRETYCPTCNVVQVKD